MSRLIIYVYSSHLFTHSPQRYSDDTEGIIVCSLACSKQYTTAFYTMVMYSKLASESLCKNHRAHWIMWDVVIIIKYFLWHCSQVSAASQFQCVVSSIATSPPEHNRTRHGVDVWRWSVLWSFVGPLCSVRNRMMCVLSWRNVSVLNRVLLWCLFPSSLHNLAKKHQNIPYGAQAQFATAIHISFSINTE